MDQEAFLDNWTYLRTELNWLDRVLATAIARQRKEVKEVNRVAQSRADQVTSHWWKGLIQMEGAIAGDSPAELPQRGAVKASYQQQMEARILASQRQGVILGLPSLCQELDLTPFEKNLVLIALAPEVSRRYGRIYNFLQETEQPGASGLPTIDLILRLLCRNDGEWRTARLSLTANSKLVQHQVVVLPTATIEPFLSHPVKLADPLVEYLLADTPQLATLEHLLQLPPSNAAEPLPPLPETWIPERTAELAQIHHPAIVPIPHPTEDLWKNLVLPPPLMAELQHLSDRIQSAQQVDQVWGFKTAETEQIAVGSVALLSGASGTGKTLAAQAIAQTLETPLFCLDLALLHATDHPIQLQHLSAQMPTVLLLKSAQVWLGRQSPIAIELLRQFLTQRQHHYTITLLSVERPSSIRSIWRNYLTHQLEFPLPDSESRLQLWQQVFPPSVPLAADIDWQTLAQLPLSGGEMRTIAREAAIYAVAESAELSMRQVWQAWETHRRLLKKPQVKPLR